MIKPYYQDESCTIYHGDCREILPTLPKVDLVLTDPPYGIGDRWVGGSCHGWAKAQIDGVKRNEWDSDIPDIAVFDMLQRMSDIQIIWGGNYFPLPQSRCWLIWNKPERGFTLSEAELAWTNIDNVVRVFDCHRNDSDKQHPTQKPIDLMLWCLSHSWSKNCNNILDPFMGSGTTLVAAKKLNRHCIGIEIKEKYCEIAVQRLQQTVMDLPMETPEVKQHSLM